MILILILPVENAHNYTFLSSIASKKSVINVSLSSVCVSLVFVDITTSSATASAIASAIAAINAGFEEGENGFDAEVIQFGICFGTVDFKEGTSAFLEKRRADFPGE